MYKKMILVMIAGTLFQCTGSSAAAYFNLKSLREGDIIFQETKSAQAAAIKLATKSNFTHAGMVVIHNGKMMVIEAVQPVRITSINAFISRGVKGRFTVKRHIDSGKIITPEALKKMKARGSSLLGKDYDPYFEWSDSRIYCTELIWKMYDSAGIKICGLEKLKNFDLTHPAVKKLMKQRYGNRIPLDEPVVSPAGMAASPLLKIVYSK